MKDAKGEANSSGLYPVGSGDSHGGLQIREWQNQRSALERTPKKSD